MEEDDDIVVIDEIKVDESKHVKKAIVEETRLEGANDEPEEDVEEMIKCRAKMIQLRKKSTSPTDRVASGIMEITEGQHKGQKAFFLANTLYVWGHHLSKADLNYNVRSGDEYIVEAVKNQDQKFYAFKVKRGWMGQETKKPVAVTSDRTFAEWLESRNLGYSEFMKWINGELPKKHFFPLPSEVFQAKVCSLYREQGQTTTGLLKITSPGCELEGKYAAFDREDFYLHGVNVGKSDLGFACRAGDNVMCQLEPILIAQKKKYQKVIKDSVNYEHLAYLVYVGEHRPKSATMTAFESVGLAELLAKNGMTAREFEDMRTGALSMNFFPAAQDEPRSSEVEATPTTGAGSAWSGKTQNPGLLKKVNEFLKERQQKSTKTTIDVVVQAQVKYHILRQSPAFDLANRVLAPGIPTGTKAAGLIRSSEEFSVATKVTKNLLEALKEKMGVDSKNIKEKFGGSLWGVVRSQKQQVEMLEKMHEENLLLEKKQQLEQQLHQHLQQTQPLMAVPPIPNVMAIPPQAAVANPVATAIQAFNEQQRLDRMRAEVQAKALDMMSKIETKKLAEKQQALLKQKQEEEEAKVKKTKPFKPRFTKVSDDVDEKSLGPLQLLRHYIVEGKKVRVEGGLMRFCSSEIVYPKDMATNFKVTRTMDLESEFYTLHTIYYFMKNHEKEHAQYVRDAIADNVSAVRKPDRASIISYMTGDDDDIGMGSSSYANVQSSSDTSEMDEVAMRNKILADWKRKNEERRREEQGLTGQRKSGKASRFESPQEIQGQEVSSSSWQDLQRGINNPQNPFQIPQGPFQPPPHPSFQVPQPPQFPQPQNLFQGSPNQFQRGPVPFQKSFDRGGGPASDPRPQKKETFTPRQKQKPVGSVRGFSSSFT